MSLVYQGKGTKVRMFTGYLLQELVATHWLNRMRIPPRPRLRFGGFLTPYTLASNSIRFQLFGQYNLGSFRLGHCYAWSVCCLYCYLVTAGSLIQGLFIYTQELHSSSGETSVNNSFN